MDGQGGQLPTQVWADQLGAEFVVPFSLALVLSLSSRHEKVIKWHLFFVQKEGLGEKITI